MNHTSLHYLELNDYKMQSHDNLYHSTDEKQTERIQKAL